MILIIIAMLMWSTLGIIIKTIDIEVSTIIFITAVISSPLLLIYILFINYNMLRMVTSSYLLIFLISIIALLNTFTFFYSYKNTTIAYAVITHYTAPFFVSILASIFLKEKITLQVILSLITATIGMYLILNISIEDFYKQMIEGHSHTLGIVAGTLSGFFYAVLIIFYKKILTFIEPLQASFFQNTFIALLIFPFVSIPVNIMDYMPQLFLMAILQSTIAPLIYLKGVKKVRANTAAILGYIEPLSAIILSIILLSEQINLMIIIGGLMILLSGLICTLYQSKNQINPSQNK